MITISHVGEGPVHSAVVGQEAEAKENFGVNLDENQFPLSSCHLVHCDDVYPNE